MPVQHEPSMDTGMKLLVPVLLYLATCQPYGNAASQIRLSDGQCLMVYHHGEDECGSVHGKRGSSDPDHCNFHTSPGVVVGGELLLHYTTIPVGTRLLPPGGPTPRNLLRRNPSDIQRRDIHAPHKLPGGFPYA